MSRFLLNLLAAANGSYDTHHGSSRWDTVLRFAQVETFGTPLGGMLNGDFENEDSVEHAPPLGDCDIVRADKVELGSGGNHLEGPVER